MKQLSTKGKWKNGDQFFDEAIKEEEVDVVYVPRTHAKARPVHTMIPVNETGDLATSGAKRVRLSIGGKKTLTKHVGVFEYDEPTLRQYAWLYANGHSHLIERLIVTKA